MTTMSFSDVVDVCWVHRGLVIVHMCLSATAERASHSALKRLVTTDTDHVFTVNPARVHPKYVGVHIFDKAKTSRPTLAMKVHSGVVRMIGTMVGITLECHIDPGITLWEKPSKHISIYPLTLEYERAMVFFGTHFKVSEFGVTEFKGALTFKTYPGGDDKKSASIFVSVFLRRLAQYPLLFLAPVLDAKSRLVKSPMSRKVGPSSSAGTGSSSGTVSSSSSLLSMRERTTQSSSAQSTHIMVLQLSYSSDHILS